MKKTIIFVAPDSPNQVFFNLMNESSHIQILFYDSFHQIELAIDHRCIGIIVCQKTLTLKELSIWCRLREKNSIPFIFLTPGDNNQLELDILNQLLSLSSQCKDKKARRERECVYLSPDTMYDPNVKMIWKHGEGQMLTLMEYRLLEYFLESGDWVSNIDHIINKVWGVDTFTSSNTVYVHIRKLREKIEADPSNPKILVTCHGLGYRLNVVNNHLEEAGYEDAYQYKSVEIEEMV
ncbi:winged helix-turn-helix domain-containing protein [Paenibacillus sp. VCA1]|uniref:winged helix-turn-helix domain-containing protein n=1 Tax=Paenibacillus sp. VCA1 TaxID=3039148 RepID=UPI002870DC72|nr:winged helix-turn-helix domain-containing protein [Paenibacillus sp. VCA1]MDR9857742.1 winged helix-turn-helix domain-containing protein [Paenibacillus sp. VCA1]